MLNTKKVNLAVVGFIWFRNKILLFATLIVKFHFLSVFEVFLAPAGFV